MMRRPSRLWCAILVAILSLVVAGGALVYAITKSKDKQVARTQVVQKDSEDKTEELAIKLNGTIRCWINGVIVEGCLRRQVVAGVKRQPLPQPRLQARRGVPGIRGPEGPGGVEGRQGNQGRPGRDGKDGVDGKDGQDGIDGQNGAPGRGPTPEEIAGAVAAYCSIGNNCAGPAAGTGQPGRPPTMEEVASAVAAYCASNSNCRGPQGEPGADSTVPGPPGPPGADSTVPGPPGPPGEQGPPGPPATPTP